MDIELKSSATDYTEITKEDDLLGSKSPFLTVMRLNIPGFLFALSHVVQDSLDLYFIKDGYGSDGVTVVSISAIIRMLIVGFSTCYSQGITRKFTELFTKHEHEQIGELFVEMIRFNVILSIFMTILMKFITKPLISRMGIPSNLLNVAENYLLPITFLPIFISTLFLTAGILLASGRSILSGFMSIMSYLLSLVFDPIIIYVLKLNLNYIGIAFAAGPIIISVILFIPFVSNSFKFIQPRWRAFFKKPSKNFWSLLKLTLPLLNTTALGTISPIIFTMLIKKISKDEATTAKICTIYSTTMKVHMYLFLCVTSGIGGLIPSATYALCKNDKKRFKEIILWTLLIPFSITFVIASIMIIKPYLILQIWVKEKDPVIKVISPVPFYSDALDVITQILLSMIIVYNHGWLASISPFVKAAALLIPAVLFQKFAVKKVWIMHSYNIQDICSFLVTLIIFCTQ